MRTCARLMHVCTWTVQGEGWQGDFMKTLLLLSGILDLGLAALLRLVCCGFKLLYAAQQAGGAALSVFRDGDL